MAKVNTPGLKFGKGFLVIKYSKKIGSNLVTSGSLEITKGNIIKNNLYDLEYQDINSSNILIQIDSKLPSDSLYTFSDNTESILHVRLNLNDFINIVDISKKDLMVMGNLFYYCIDDYTMFDSLIVEGGYQPSNSTSPIGIEYTFENGVVTQNNTKFSIDLFAKATASSLYSDGHFYINYNDLGFGENIIDNGTFAFTPKDLIANQSIYHVFLKDFDNNTILLIVYSELVESGYSVLSTEARNMGTLTFSILNCQEEKGISFDPQTSADDHIHYVGPITSSEFGELYSPVIADDQENGKICGCDKPIITSFSPTTIHAGTGEILTINGSNFGNFTLLKSSVLFKDGDFTGEFMEPKQAYFIWDNITHWSDTKIEIKVPSVSRDEFFKRPPASGKFKVRNDCNEEGLSNDILEIPYSILNVQKNGPENESGVKLIVNNTSPNGVVFQFSNSIPTNGTGQIIRQAFSAALNEWCQNTNINFSLGPDTDQTTTSAGDNINIITYGDCGGIGVACLSIAGHYSYCNGGQTSYMLDLDFQVKNSSNASFIDFKNRFLHELGHAHMLNHSYEPYWGSNWSNQYLMYYQSPPVGTSTSIKNADKVGALLVFPNSSACGNGIGYGACGTSSIEDEDYIIDIKLFPNPISSIIHISNNSDHKINDIQIINTQGEKLLKNNQNIEEVNFEKFPVGIYFAIITVDNGKILTYKIIKQ